MPKKQTKAKKATTTKPAKKIGQDSIKIGAAASPKPEPAKTTQKAATTPQSPGPIPGIVAKRSSSRTSDKSYLNRDVSNKPHKTAALNQMKEEGSSPRRSDNKNVATNMTPEQARLELQAAIRFANGRTNDYHDFVRQFRKDDFDRVHDGINNGAKRIQEALKVCKLVEGGKMKDEEYQVLCENTLRDMRTGMKHSANMKDEIINSESFKNAEHGILHSRDQMHQLMQKQKPMQELSPRASGQVRRLMSPSWASTTATTDTVMKDASPFGNTKMKKEKGFTANKKEVLVQDSNVGLEQFGAFGKRPVVQKQKVQARPVVQKQIKSNKVQAPIQLNSKKIGNNGKNQAPKPIAMGQPEPEMSPTEKDQKRSLVKQKSAKMKQQIANKKLQQLAPGGKQGKRKGAKAQAQRLLTDKTHIDGYELNQRQLYECSDKQGNFHECVIRGKTGNNTYRVSVILSNGITIQNAFVLPHEILPFGTKSISSPTGWMASGIPSKFVQPAEPIPDAISCDWSVFGIPSQIRGVSWSGHYNRPFARRYNINRNRETELMMDWSQEGNIPGTMYGPSWAHGKLEEFHNPTEHVMDWSADGLNHPHGDINHPSLTHLKKYYQKYVEPADEISCDWSAPAVQHHIDNVGWANHYKNAIRSEHTKDGRKLKLDHAKLQVDWKSKGLPESAEGQGWTRHFPNHLAERGRMIKRLTKSRPVERASGFRKSEIRNYNINTFEGVDKELFLDDRNVNKFKNRKQEAGLRGLENSEHLSHIKESKHNRHMDKMRELKTKMQANIFGQRTKNKKAYNYAVYEEKMSNLIRDVGNKREWKNWKRKCAREVKWQQRAGIEFLEGADQSNIYWRKGQSTRQLDVNRFITEVQHMYEAKSNRGKWFSCVVKANKMDGTYLVSIPLQGGVTLSDRVVAKENIRPHLISDTRGLYEAEDDNGVFWDVVVNEHMEGGHVNIHVLADNGLEHPELKTHWSKVRLKIHLNVPNLYEAMDKQGYYWPITVTKHMPNDFYSFNCYLENKVVTNVKAHHNDIRLKKGAGRLQLMSDEQLKNLPTGGAGLKKKVKPAKPSSTPPAPVQHVHHKPLIDAWSKGAPKIPQELLSKGLVPQAKPRSAGNGKGGGAMDELQRAKIAKRKHGTDSTTATPKSKKSKKTAKSAAPKPISKIINQKSPHMQDTTWMDVMNIKTKAPAAKPVQQKPIAGKTQQANAPISPSRRNISSGKNLRNVSNKR